MAITFYDDILSPKLVLKDPFSIYSISLQAVNLSEDSVYYLPAVPSDSGKVLSTTNAGAMYWIDVASRDYIASRSGNLISNFSGHFGDNTNFSNFTYDPLYSPPSFKTAITSASLPLDELIVVDTNETYKMSVWTKWLSLSDGSYSMGLECLDVDGRIIKAKHTMYKANTTTYVTQDVVEGDAYIYVDSIDNWNEMGTDIERSFIFWDEVSEGGYVYPAETYSRHVLQNAWDSSSPFDINENRIELRETWDIDTHGPLPVSGTILSNGNDQGTTATDYRDKYMMNTLTNVSGEDLLFDWTQHTGTIGGIDTTGTGDSSKFFPGTHSVKPKWEISGASSNTVVFNNPFFGRDYSSNGGNADNIGNADLEISDTTRTLKLASGGNFQIVDNSGSDLILFASSTLTFVKPLIVTGSGVSSGQISLREAPDSGGSNSITLKAPLSLEDTNIYTLPSAFPGTSGYVLSSTGDGIMSWQAGGTGGGEDSVYHAVENATGVAGVGYYYDSLAGSKHLAMILQNRRSDIIQHGVISNLELYSETGGVYVPVTEEEAPDEYEGIRKLLDGRRDTVYNLPNTYLKFRFQVEVSTPWPHQTMVALQTGWTAATWAQPQILVEEYADSQWDVLVTADFTNANGVTNWGLSAYASQGLHTGQGGSGLTRITVDFSGFSSQAGSTTVPLQNLYISSNYYGEENTGPAYHDYNNIINYDRDLVIPNSIRHEGDTNNHIALGSDSQTYYTDGSERVLIDNSGFRLGGTQLPDAGASATVTGIDPDILLGGAGLIDASDTLLVTQLAVKSYIHGLLYDDGSEPTGDDTGLSPGMIGDGTVSSTEFGYLSTVTGNIQSQLNSGVTYTTANTTAISAIQDVLQDSTGGGGKGVYTDSGKAQTSSYLGLKSTNVILQAGANTAYEAEEASPGTLTMSVQSGASGSEVSVTAITIAGDSSVHNAITTFNQKAVFSMVADFDSTANFNSTVDLNGNATGISTSEVTEGTNLYFTDARAQAALTAGTNITITAGEIVASTNTVDVQTYLSGGSATTIETSGDVTVGGNLIVSGTQTQLNTTTLEVEDINIVVGKLATTSTLTNGAGLTFGAWSSGAIPTLTWDHANTRFAMNKSLATDIVGDLTGDVTGATFISNVDTDVNISLGAGGIGFEANTSDSFIFNGGQNDVDFQVTTENDQNTFYIDGATDKVGIGVEIPTEKLDVDGNIAVSGTVDGIDIATDVAANTAKTGITSGQASAITANTAKTSFPGFGTSSSTALAGDTALLALGTSSTTALAGDTALLALGTSSSTALAGDTTTISSAQASAITANTAKTSYTDASAVAANTAKISYSTAASDAVALNTAKTGITSGQAAEITANTAKVSNIVQTTITGNAGTATVATTVTVTDNESTAENNLITFVADAGDATGNHGLEMDGNLYYNPDTGLLSSTGMSAASFIGDLMGDVTGDVEGDLTGNADTVTNGVYTNADQEITSETQINKRKFSNVSATDGDCEGDIIYIGTAAASHVAGDIYTLDSSSQWVITDADASATSIGLLAVAMGSAVSDGMCIRGFVSLKTTFAGSPATGAILYLDDATAGAATGTAPGSGKFVRILGYKLGSGERMWFNPDNTYVEVA